MKAKRTISSIVALLNSTSMVLAQTILPGTNAVVPQVTPTVSHNFVTGYPSAGGALSQAQPSFSDLTGTIGTAQCPVAGTTTLGCLATGTGLTISSGTASLAAVSPVSNQWIDSIGSTGLAHLSQPAFTSISGTLSVATQCPVGTTGTIGCVGVGGGLFANASGFLQLNTVAGVTHQWISSIDSSGTAQLSQPGFADLSGTLSSAQCVVGGSTTLGCLSPAASGGLAITNGTFHLAAVSPVSHQWINSIGTTGLATQTQPGFTDISGTATLAQLPSIAPSTFLSNVSGATSAPAANSIATGVIPFIQNGAGYLPGQPGTGGAINGAIGESIFMTTDPSIHATVSISNSSPATVTWTANGIAANCQTTQTNVCAFPIVFTGLNGSHGITNNATYWTIPGSLSTNTFTVASSPANAFVGTAVNTSGTDSGTATTANLIAASGTTQAMGAMNLPAGNWLCSGNVDVLIGGASQFLTTMSAGLNTVTNSIYVPDGSAQLLQFTMGTGVGQAINVGPKLYVFAAQTPIYLNEDILWGGGGTNPLSGGSILCHRFR